MNQSAEDLIRIIEMEGKIVRWREPGEIVCDVEGLPIGVSPGSSGEATLLGVTLTTDQWELVARYLINERNQTND